MASSDQHTADRETAEEWGRRMAATFPPFTAAEAAEVGRIAAAIDARRREQQASTTSKAA